MEGVNRVDKGRDEESETEDKGKGINAVKHHVEAEHAEACKIGLSRRGQQQRGCDDRRSQGEALAHALNRDDRR